MREERKRVARKKSSIRKMRRNTTTGKHDDKEILLGSVGWRIERETKKGQSSIRRGQK